ncbi:NAD-binding protein [Leptospira borgpetersenii serovar Javanica str. UI 09931]|uniref:NAD-binding protein n=1 Tax=Leptospira borgpetersenii serovar Javanica str. UI 09931 TaxID=1049767 RepID=A0AAV3J6W6_LEPBO|nr:NAD-binding protein [Leptospira borgpetersenii str. UI 09149]EKQ99069.1 NAD-binding protein [Leptospira borgpetersenii serovar Castellonis str. 200801910]EMK08816.1 NAD-binding protein [Leptospira sp. serovar Kenya str. Sh9]EMN58497.1 NAD-binding protein [Leptospira borgpetersenii serovar Javanica str. MK146]EMO08142.1 NAD-binding protein [Leptospira borgpetersenii str. Noumea 25]EPG56253.1 NAD-binding protein [Leptospira borgpetersenii serovar Javanica str. UI 09931]
MAAKLEFFGKKIYYHSRSVIAGPQKNTIQFDLSDPNLEKLDLPEFDVVYHLAGQTSVPQAKLDPVSDLQINVFGFLNLILCLKKQKKKPIVIFAGTTTETGLHQSMLIDEDVRDEPLTFYDISKLSAEHYLKQCIREGWVLGCILRLANVYGGSKPGQEKDRGILDKVFHRALKGETIQIYGDGTFLRDYIHLDDVVSAFISASDHIENTNGKHFIIGSGKSYSIREAFETAVNIAFEISGLKTKIEYMDPPINGSPIDSRSVIYDTSSFRSATGWKPNFLLESGLRHSYILKNGTSI